MPFRVSSVPPEIAARARESLTSPQYGHPAHAEVARGYGPCRVCLEPFVTGRDRRLLFTFNPFDEGVPAPGPVFIHENACAAFERPGFPDSLRELPLLFEPLDVAGLPLDRIRPEPEGIDEVIAALFDRDRVASIIVRNAEAGCFIARIARSDLRPDRSV